MSDRHSWPIDPCPSPKGPRSVVSEPITRRFGVNYEEDIVIIQHLKSRRSRALATLTRKRNQIEALLIDDPENLPRVELKLDEYDTYDNAIHDSTAKTESFIYFIDVKKGYLDFQQQVSLWMSQIDPRDSVSRFSSSSYRSMKSQRSRIFELEARQESLQRRKELHERELRLKGEQLKLEMEREQIGVEEELNNLRLKQDQSLSPTQGPMTS
jgi:hypothetical protein